uniref:Uncharacterized protein n=1 Tax=Oryza glumipatula TaxID=40148 RepID=A0A0E0AWD1_9ORYZ
MKACSTGLSQYSVFSPISAGDVATHRKPQDASTAPPLVPTAMPPPSSTNQSLKTSDLEWNYELKLPFINHPDQNQRKGERWDLDGEGVHVSAERDDGGKAFLHTLSSFMCTREEFPGRSSIPNCSRPSTLNPGIL